jgi:starch phosphorylase
MVNLAIVGTHSINGVAKLHSDLLKDQELNHFYQIYPERFNNKTNGIIHRHWLLSANHGLTSLIRELIGDEFMTDPKQLKQLMAFDQDASVLDKIEEIKHQNKIAMTKYIQQTTGIQVNPYSIFDMQAKRIHEYKRQLLNILHVMHLYKTLKSDPNLDMVPRTFIFSGKAAPGYFIAKEIIKLINVVAKTVNNDLTIKDKLKVVFLENYSVSVATKMIPAADVSEQISTTTKEASGTGNMKFMMNGAITLATLDGANVEIRDEVGEDNIVLFGLKEDEVYEYYRTGAYDAAALYYSDPLIRETVDALTSGEFHVSQEEFRAIYETLVKFGDKFFVLKDFQDYKTAQATINDLYLDRQRWSAMSLRNTAASGVFSSDYTIQRYAQEIWHIDRLPHEKDR